MSPIKLSDFTFYSAIQRTPLPYFQGASCPVSFSLVLNSPNTGEIIDPTTISVFSPPSSGFYATLNSISTYQVIISEVMITPSQPIFDLLLNFSDPTGHPHTYTLPGVQCLRNYHIFSGIKKIDPAGFNLVKMGKSVLFEGQNLIIASVEFGFDTLTTVSGSVKFNTMPFVFEETYFPPLGSNIVQDYQLLRYNFHDYITVERTESLFSNLYNESNSVYFSPFAKAAANQTHSTYLFTRSFYSSINPGELSTYILNSKSTSYSNSYYATYQPFITVGSSTFNYLVSEETNGFLTNVTSNIGIIVKPVLSVSLSPFSSDSFGFTVPYPSSYNSSTNQFTYNFVLPLYKYITNLETFSISPGLDVFPTFNYITNPAYKSMVLNNLSFRQTTWYQTIVRVNITAMTNCPTSSFAILNTRFGLAQMIYTSNSYSVYEYEFHPNSIEGYFFRVFDLCNNMFTFYSSLAYNANNPNDTLPELPPQTLLIFDTDFTYLEFSSNHFDLTLNSANVKLLFRLSPDKVRKDMEPAITIGTYSSKGLYSEELSAYVIDFTIKKNTAPGVIDYNLYFDVLGVSSQNLMSILGSNATLTVDNSIFDEIAPMITMVNSYPANNVSFGALPTMTIGWDITIFDSPTGFSSGVVNVISDLDLLPRTFKISLSDKISGSSTLGVYQIRFPLNSTCRTQTYTLANITLTDGNSKSYEQVNPLSGIYGTVFENETKITVNCPKLLIDDEAPKLISFSFSPNTIDVGSLSRTVLFSLFLQDNLGGSDISIRHLPVIHLISENGNFLEFTTNLTKIIQGPTPQYRYELAVEIPYGFGASQIFINIYGVVDNYNNYRSYSSLDLRGLSSPYFILRNHTVNQPIIESSTNLFKKGGSLTIYGKAFGVSNTSFISQIDYQDGNGFVNLDIDFHSGIVLQYKNRIKPITSNIVKFRVFGSNGIASNIFTIPIQDSDPQTTTTGAISTAGSTTTGGETTTGSTTSSPTTTPTTPPKCPGTPECNNNGQCINFICQCNQPWYGPSCSSKNIIVPIPPAYPEPTTGTNITESGSLITTSIEIIGIRELDDINNIVEQFNISNWNFTDQTAPTTNPKYFYSTQINQRSTILNVTIEYFKQSTNITFANQNLFIPQSTIKFTMNLNSYRFKQPTNTLQILMKAAIESDQSDVCSSSGFGSVNGSIQWIKLNVGDQSLYGRFLSDGMVDNTVTPIKNVIIDQDDIDSEQSKQSRSAIVGITIPSYSDSVDLDPDFSNLVDVGSSDTSDFICPKKGLSNGAIAGIVVGGVVFVAVSVGAVLLFMRKRKTKKEEKRVKKRLSELRQNNDKDFAIQRTPFPYIQDASCPIAFSLVLNDPNTGEIIDPTTITVFSPPSTNFRVSLNSVSTYQVIISDVIVTPGQPIFDLVLNLSDATGKPLTYTLPGVQCLQVDPAGFNLVRMGQAVLFQNSIIASVEFGFDTLPTTSGTVTLNTMPVVFEEVYFPPSGSNIIQDYQLLQYNLLDYITVERTESLISILSNFSISNFAPFVKVVANQTHSTYLYTRYLSGTVQAGQLSTYILNSKSTSYSNNYHTTYLPLITIGSSTFNYQVNEETNGFLTNVTSNIGIIVKPELYVVISGFGANSFQFTVPYPSSYNSSTNQFTYNFVLPLYKYITKLQVFSISPGLEVFPTFNYITNPAYKSMVLNNLSFRQTTWYQTIVRVNITAMINCPTSSFIFGHLKFGLAQMIFTSDSHSVYEYEFYLNSINGYNFRVLDLCNNMFTFYNSLAYNANNPNDTLPELPQTLLIFDTDFTYLEFSSNHFDLTLNSANVKLLFRLSPDKVRKDMEPAITIGTYSSKGLYSEELSAYVIDFTIKKNTAPGVIDYWLDFLVSGVSCENLMSILGSNATLTVDNSIFDEIAPMITMVNSYPANNVSFGALPTMTIGWDITIFDSPTGFSSGVVNVISDLDLLPRTFKISLSDKISGSSTLGVYQIRFPLNSTCRTQTYTLANITLTDGNSKLYEQVNPLSGIYGTVFENETKITLNCPKLLIDDEAPKLISFSFSPNTIDVGSLSRTVLFSLFLQDNLGGSDISIRHLPVIHLISENGNFLEFTTNLTKIIQGPTLQYRYDLAVEIPYGFGASQIFINIYGVVDNYNNYRSYSSIDLRDLSFPYFIIRNHTVNQPIIESSTNLFKKGGSLTIYGKAFGVSNTSFISQIDYQDGNGFVNLDIDFHSGIVLQYKNRIKPITSNIVKFRVFGSNGIASNIFTIPIQDSDPQTTTTGAISTAGSTTGGSTTGGETTTGSTTSSPTTTPTTPPKCPGTPECNNNGQCINSICQCYQPWYGPSCSSKIVIIPIPPAYPEPTTGTNITESGSLITTSIEIIGIRELDDINNIVEQFNISNWNFTDQTTPTTNPKYFYSTQINQRSTILNVTIEYFKQSTNITFANQNLFIPQSTIKFAMNLNSYRFKQPTNTLQILMKAAIESDQSDVCSSSGFGSVNGSIQWIKLNVGDQSLYGRFLSDGMVDNTVTPIKNVIIDQDDIDSEQSKQSRSAIVGITIPSYSDSVDLDPDFSNLVDVGSSDTSDFICPKKGLSNGAIAGIVVGGVVFVAVSVGAVLLFMRKRKTKKEEKRVKKRLSELRQNNDKDFSSQGEGTNKLFIFKTTVLLPAGGPSGITKFILDLDIASSSSVNKFQLYGFQCYEFDMNSFDIGFVGQPVLYDDVGKISVSFEMVSPLNQSITPVGGVLGNSFSCAGLSLVGGKYGNILFGMNSGYTNPLPSNISATLTFRGRTIVFNVTNIFPSSTRTSVVVSETFAPASGLTIQQDYQLANLQSNHFLTVSNPNSYFVVDITGTQYPFRRSKSNSTHTVYSQRNNYISMTVGFLKTYVLDKTSTLYSSSYGATYNLNSQYQNSKFVASPRFDSKSNTIFLNCTATTFFNYNVLYKYQILNSPGQFNLRAPYPSFNNVTGDGSFTYYFELPFYKNVTQQYPELIVFPAGLNTVSLMLLDKSIVFNIILNNVTFRQVSWSTVLVRMNVSSTNCPVDAFMIGQTPFNSSILVYGDHFNGVYEAEVYFPPLADAQITIYDGCNHQSVFPISLNYNPDKPTITLSNLPNLEYYVYPSNISYFSFLTNDIDLTATGDIVVTLQFKLKIPVKTLTPSITLANIAYEQFGAYDNSLNLYVINFNVSQNNPHGNIFYTLKFSPIFQLTVDILQSYMGNNATLRISKSNCDYINPMIVTLMAIPSNSNSFPTDSTTINIGWQMRITDPSGFAGGTVQVISDYDLNPRSFVITSFTNRKSGNEYDGTYEFTFPVTGKCRNQVFKIVNATFFDMNSPATEYTPFDPLTPIYGSAYEQQIKSYIYCNSFTMDATAPTLTNFNMTPSVIDVGRINREVTLNLTVLDTGGSDVSMKNPPVVQLTSENGNSLDVTTKYIGLTEGPSGYEYRFSAVQQLPFGFGFTKIFANVFGINDDFQNYRSYSPSDLDSLGFPYFITKTFSTIQPIIESSSRLTSNGVYLTIYGKSFGLNPNGFVSQINYNDGNGYQNLTSIFHSGVILQYNNLINPIDSNFVFFRVIKDNIASNELNITVYFEAPFTPETTTTTTTGSPTTTGGESTTGGETSSTTGSTTATPTSTPKPQTCLGTPECNNNGQCINLICQCNQPWYGPSCSSKTVIIPIPPAYPEPTTGTNITESGSLITTSIEIIGIRELDDINNIVEQFNISNWNFTDQTTPTTNPKYFYSTQINQRSTILNVTIEYFKQSTNITFANQNLFIPQSTIKFTMNLNSYRFKQPTNTLQILMKAAIESDQSDVCSSSGFGSVNGSIQWIKLNVGDQSLYGRFLSDGMVDNTVTPIKNAIIDQDDIDSEQNKQFRSAIVGITIPSYSDSVDLDPDFSNLIDVGSSDTSNVICSPKKGLSNGAIAGIVVGGVLFVSIIIGTTLFLVKRKELKEHDRKIQKRIEMNKRGL
ncbi:hypothetical protein PPL_11382 [Heterostelium album PN500]|uniref:EGF-like domain-containing protein n=1 Tax=Heterostelium pallidum (strain ATCC 26659 / Pp 5 / PN500) TaxID=670386 RepID=D3BT89_HETP5|nr:hypothetical protein PPL_11382 [Heterostelium album PN500]EFA75306.1 hypothetical protein PPL_11382 [Heterostelium album PN500]|eukprot:XP_020427440.1 hypothetical protein PPL_11382 [Heterostelium album PN500]